MEELSEKSEKELLQNLKEAEKSLFGLHIRKCSSALDKPHMIALLRKQIAKIKTFLKQKACKSSNK